VRERFVCILEEGKLFICCDELYVKWCGCGVGFT
jgi:hypothetical protein